MPWMTGGLAKRNRNATHDSKGESDKMLHRDTGSQRVFLMPWHSMRRCLVAVGTSRRSAESQVANKLESQPGERVGPSQLRAVGPWLQGGNTGSSLPVVVSIPRRQLHLDRDPVIRQRSGVHEWQRSGRCCAT